MPAHTRTIISTPENDSILLPQNISDELRLLPHSDIEWSKITTLSSKKWHTPDITLIGSPLPVKTWGSLIRASFRISEKPCSAEHLICVLEAASIFPRTIDIDDIANNFLLSDSKDNCGFATSRIHAILEVGHSQHIILQNMHAGANILREILQDVVNDFLSRLGLHDSIHVERTSPLSVLNELQSSERPIDWARKTRVNDEPHGLAIPMEIFRSELWPGSRARPVSMLASSDQPVAILMSADREEQIVKFKCFNLYNRNRGEFVIVDFNLVIPSGGLESIWMHWTSKIIGSESNGTILGGYSSARTERRWVTLHLTAAFKSSAAASNALHRLQGEESRYLFNSGSDPYWTDLCERLEIKGTRHGTAGDSTFPTRQQMMKECLSKDEFERKRNTEAQTFSSLQCVTPHGILHESCNSKPIANPFCFTKPISIDNPSSYTWPLDPDGRSALVTKICDIVKGTSGENVVIVGSQRTGKTSILRAIQRRLGESNIDANDPRYHLIIINASTTPPAYLFVTIADHIIRNCNELLSSTQIQMLGASLKRFLSTVPGELFNIAKNIGTGKLLKLLGEEDATESSILTERSRSQSLVFQDQLGDARCCIDKYIERLADGPELSAARFMKSSLIELDHCLNFLENHRFIIAIDEMANSASWNQEWTFPIWRDYFESSQDNAPRWIISSLQSLTDATGFSPLGNSIREINLSPLTHGEVMGLVNKFKNAHDQFSPVLPSDVRRPIQRLTGRHPYLMQVVLFHLWEAVWDVPATVATHELLDDIVKNRVLPELFDFFSSISKPLKARENLWNSLKQWKSNREEGSILLNSSDLKLLKRAGLLDVDRMCPVELLTMWVSEQS